MFLGQALRAAIERLAAASVPSPRMNAELLLMFTLSRDRAYLYGHPEYELTSDEQLRYEEALAERSQGIPAQYITGHQEFWGMDLVVNPAVLIPRPETEHVVEAVINRVGSGFWPGKIVDVGTGSGCIALALAKELPRAQIYATEISPAALEIARANAARHQLNARIRFHAADLVEGLEGGSFDFVVSNPPYVGESEQESVQLEVRRFEPRGAVFAGPEGTEVIERLIPQARQVLAPGGWLVIEISGTISGRVRELLSGWAQVEIKSDLQGIPRVASARKP
ncbi:MAG: peptide chain release factor N(5)-glutamine methyltransferase [Acidobacteria bacterium]|nr:peptide chain release factor N(5)-glutamine methyltransferase [Acidobacteriota bacterium]